MPSYRDVSSTSNLSFYRSIPDKILQLQIIQLKRNILRVLFVKPYLYGEMIELGGGGKKRRKKKNF